ncbi:Transposase DDE domain protein [Corynebacterium occultum]|uniref:Transposase DDE domain protein n=1 Tax=Corynebacterium occultum TaxID=2675219 RepID=A0A6B8W3R0_9CORY|nr:NF041680 family putative transposase [Corynebacterium occultum]QGU07171.1 Transposase DDE domain protein [Corynebacterium occultum]
MIINHPAPPAPPRHDVARLDRFRTEFYSCLARRGDALFELTDTVACSTSPVTDLAHLSLEAEHRRGHGALYDAINHGYLDTTRLQHLMAQGPIPTITGPAGRDRIVLAVDVSNWLRPDAATSPDRSFCHTYPRGRGQAQMIPGWPYSFVAALETGACSWTALLDVVRLHADDDATAVTATQLRRVLEHLTPARHHRAGDLDVLVVLDAGYDVVRLAWLLDDLPVTLIARLRSDRVFHAPAGARRGPTKGRPPRHGARLVLADPTTHPAPDQVTATTTARYGHAETVAFARMHPKLGTRSGWRDHDGELPIIKGTVVGLRVERLPGDRSPTPVWLWVSKPVPDDGAEVDHWWSMYVRRFDLEHTFRFLKQALGWTRPRLRDPAAADRWTWLILVAHTQLLLARPLARDHRLPWHKPLPTVALTPARVRAGYRRICRMLAHPAGAPKPTRPGPRRPRGRGNREKALIQPVGKDPKG